MITGIAGFVRHIPDVHLGTGVDNRDDVPAIFSDCPCMFGSNPGRIAVFGGDIRACVSADIPVDCKFVGRGDSQRV